MSRHGAASGLQTARAPRSSERAAGVWVTARVKARIDRATGPSALETDVHVLEELEEAPPRTRHIHSIVRSSPLPPAVRTMLERRDFAAPLDVDVAEIKERLPGLECPAGPVEFLADSGSLERLGLSVDGLLAHRRQLLALSIDSALPRRAVMIVGAGPGGLMTAVQLRLRDHEVVVCEQREAYSRNRFIGVYKDVAHLMAALGMPEQMTYDFTHYRGKRGIMLADIQTFLHAVALKLGVVVYTAAVARITEASLERGELTLVRSTAGDASSIGLTRWHHDSIARVSSGVAIRFDAIVDASGGRAGVRELIVGHQNVVSLRSVAAQAARRDPSLKSYFDDPEDHCAEFVESDYGCPPSMRADFVSALMDGGPQIPDELPCFVSNIDASVLTKPIQESDRLAGLGARIDDKELAIPPDWVVVQCPLSDGRLTRYQIEGPLPITYQYGDRRLPTRDSLARLNPLSLLVRVLYAMGVPFESVDREQLVRFAEVEAARADASDVVATWMGRFRGLRLGAEEPMWTGTVPGSETTQYAVVGEALQNAWYRFGVGVDDTFAGAARFVEGLDLTPEERRLEAKSFERVMTARSVQVLYHLYAVSRHTEQGVVGPVLTEYRIDEQRALESAAAGLRAEAAKGQEMLALRDEIGTGRDELLESALDYHVEACCRRVERPPAETASPHLARILEHAAREAPAAASISVTRREERILELALGRFEWASPWLRACAVRAADASRPGAVAPLTRAAADPDPLVAETATAALSDLDSAPHLTIEKVKLLKQVSIFAAVTHDNLVPAARALTEHRAQASQRIVSEGDAGDCLYLIVSGRVRVHDGERTLRHLAEQEYFGELSLLDAEPRSADVTAVEDTHLFRLDSFEFHRVTAEQPEVALAVSRVLCRQLRSLTDG